MRLSSVSVDEQRHGEREHGRDRGDRGEQHRQ